MPDSPRIRSRHEAASRRPLISLDDVVKCAELPFIFLVAWLVPYRWWGRLSRAYVKLRSMLHTPRHRSLLEKLERTMPALGGYPSPSEVATELEVNRYLHYADVAREYRPRAKPVPTKLVGLAHLEQAKRDGAGAILLVGHFVHNGLIPKAALHDAGMAPVHLSRAEHGFSKTRFGIRVLNPVRRSREDRYLRARVLFTPDTTVGVTRRLHQELAENGVVSITAGAWEGNRVMELPLMERRYPIATGAFALARLSGAPILPLTAVRDHQSGVTTITIDEPLAAGGSSDRLETLWRLGTDAVSRLKPRIRESPGQWRGWQYLRPAD